jgi:2'-hydroxyisoflavone reductase
MRILILGGTLYLGRHLVDAARARGHEVTLFNRGRTGPDLFPDLERITGDRETDLGALRGRRWDRVLDTSGYLPRVVRASGELLRDRVEHYAFVSSISVYADSTRPGMVETDPVARLDPGAAEELAGETYGALKALCEETLESLMPDRVLRVRAGMIFGPLCPLGRSAYWPRRVAAGGEVLAPGAPQRNIQLVDVRDLADWIVRASERKTAGVFNATGPGIPLTMERFLATCRSTRPNDARFTWVDEEFLLEQKVSAYNELPLWVPERYQAFESVNVSRAVAAGLSFRPLEETLRDTLEWASRLPPDLGRRQTSIEIPAPMTSEREAGLLDAWRQRVSTRA